MKVGQLELKPTSVSQTIRVGDESGYEFTVQADWDGETGWHATVGMQSHGLKTAESAVLHLRHAAEHFVRMLSDEPSTAPERDDE
jgi:hypothetical protein